MSTIFQDGTVYAKTKIEMINTCLLTIGEVPLDEYTDVDKLQLGTDAETAKRIVEATMIEVQSRGWYFNTDYNFTLTPDINGFITVPPNTMRLDFGNSSDRHQYTLRDNSVYDFSKKTFEITKPLEADITWLVDYDILPAEAFQYISLRAARKFQQKVIGATETDAFAVRDETEAYLELQRRQLQYQDFTMRNDRVSTRIHSGYLQRALYGATNRRMF